MPARTREDANAQQRKWYRAHKAQHIAIIRRREREVLEWFKKFKSTKKCPCGESDPRCLDFHHSNPADKTGNIANMVRRTTLSRLGKEIGKCVVLCANCHRKRHKQFMRGGAVW